MAWTAPRTWTDGELVTAAIMNPHIRDNLNSLGPVTKKVKAADETVANTTLQNDDDLFFAVGANEKWLVDCTLMIDSNATADFKMTFTVPASATMKWGPLSINASGLWIQDPSSGTNPLLDAAATSTVGSLSAGQIWGIIVKGIVQVAGTAGTVQFQWAQSVTSGSTLVKAGSCLIAQKLS